MIAAIIVTYNGSDFILNCLGGLMTDFKPEHIYLVDNGSEDDTLIKVRKSFPAVIIKELKYNHGFGFANNVAIKEILNDTTFTHIYLINQDTFQKTNVAHSLATIMRRHPGLGIISPMQLKQGGNIDPGFNEYIRRNTAYVRDLDHDSLQSVYYLNYVNAACWLISVDCIRATGGFDSHLFFHYGEDHNYCQRALYLRFKIGFTPELDIIHLRSGARISSEEGKLSMLAVIWNVKLGDIRLSGFRFNFLFIKQWVILTAIVVKAIVQNQRSKLKIIKDLLKTRKLLSYKKLTFSRKTNKYTDLPWLK